MIKILNIIKLNIFNIDCCFCDIYSIFLIKIHFIRFFGLNKESLNFNLLLRQFIKYEAFNCGVIENILVFAVFYFLGLMQWNYHNGR